MRLYVVGARTTLSYLEALHDIELELIEHIVLGGVRVDGR